MTNSKKKSFKVPCLSLETERIDVPKKKKKFYRVVSKKSKYTHGAFEHSSNGLRKAKDYIKELSSKTDEEFEILEK